MLRSKYTMIRDTPSTYRRDLWEQSNHSQSRKELSSHAQKIGPSQTLTMLTKKSAASGDENGSSQDRLLIKFLLTEQ